MLCPTGLKGNKQTRLSRYSKPPPHTLCSIHIMRMAPYLCFLAFLLNNQEESGGTFMVTLVQATVLPALSPL